MLLSLLHSHSTCTSAHSCTCMNERTHNLKASVPQGTGFESFNGTVRRRVSWDS